jgi:parvulin-like peptidyl-prolyl isomerase
MLKEYYKQKLSQELNKLKKDIMDEYQHSLNLENISYFCKKAGTIKTRKDSLGLFNEKEKKLVLAKTNIEETTIGEIFPLVFQYYWDSLNQERLVRMLLSNRNFRRAVNHKGMRLKLNELSEVRDELARWKVYYLKYFLIQMEIVDKIDVSVMVMLPIYDQQKNRLTIKEQRIVREIFRKTKDDIDEVYDLAAQGHDFQALEKKYQENRETRTHGIIGPFTNGPHGKLGELAFNMNINDISKPFKYRGGYSIIRLLSILPPRQRTYQETKEEIKAKYIDENKKRFISEWVDRSKEKYNLSLYEI